MFGGPILTSAFADELAAHKIVCIGCTPGQPASFYSARDPYVWGLDGSPLQKQAHVEEFLTKQIIGKNAIHGGDAVKDKPRKLGLLYLENSGAAKELADSFAAAMSAAGSPFADVVAYQLDPSTIQATATQVITRMKAAGVTTIVFNGDPVAPRDFTKEATAQEYFPEWVVAASTLVDVSAFARTYDQEQWKHAFGVTQLAARQPSDQIGSFFLYKWFTGVDPPASGSIGVFAIYPALFFAAVQAVGPNLSPETFRDTLFKLPGTSDGLAAASPSSPTVRRAIGPSPTTWASTMPPRSGGTRRSPVPTRSARTASACTSSSTAGSGTSPVSGRPSTRCSTPPEPSPCTRRRHPVRHPVPTQAPPASQSCGPLSDDLGASEFFGQRR